VLVVAGLVVWRVVRAPVKHALVPVLERVVLVDPVLVASATVPVVMVMPPGLVVSAVSGGDL